MTIRFPDVGDMLEWRASQSCTNYGLVVGRVEKTLQIKWISQRYKQHPGSSGVIKSLEGVYATPDTIGLNQYEYCFSHKIRVY